jgi:cytochrome c oxidase subunit 3
MTTADRTLNRPVLDVSGLPSIVFGQRSILWWATMCLVCIEGAAFVMALVGYYYLRTRTNDWPPGVDNPSLLWGTLNLALFLLSCVPNYWLKKIAKTGNLRKVQLGLVIISLVAIVGIVFRFLEFPALHCRWDANGYASIVWFLLGMHTFHLLTDAGDTFVLTALMFTDKVEGRRYMDVSENADYWYFVVFSWLPVWFTIYIAPRII